VGLQLDGAYRLGLVLITPGRSAAILSPSIAVKQSSSCHIVQVMALPKEAAEAVLGTALQPLLQQRMVGRNNSKKGQIAKPQIEYQDLEMHRIVGTGQFGMVRVVRHIPTNQAYALKVHSSQHSFVLPG